MHGQHGVQDIMSFVPIMEPKFSAACAVYSRYTERGLQAHGAPIWISFVIFNRLKSFIMKLAGRQYERK